MHIDITEKKHRKHLLSTSLVKRMSCTRCLEDIEINMTLSLPAENLLSPKSENCISYSFLTQLSACQMKSDSKRECDQT